MTGRLCNRRALITGASRGLGVALATELAAEGANLILIAQNASRLERWARLVQRRFQVSVEWRKANLANRSELRALVDELERNPADIIVNNAARLQISRFEGLDEHQVDELLRLNIVAPLQLSQAAIPAMRRQNWGRILNVSSAGSLLALPGAALYCATKAAVNSLSEALRRELYGSDVKVTLLIPGVIWTATTRAHLSTMRELYSGDLFESFSVFRRRRVAARSIEALIRGERVVSMMGPALSLRIWVNRFAPGFVDRRFGRVFGR